MGGLTDSVMCHLKKLMCCEQLVGDSTRDETFSMPVAHLLETRLVQRPELEGDLSDFPIVCRSQVTAQFRPTAP